MNTKTIWLLVLGILPLNIIFAKYSDQDQIPQWSSEAISILTENELISGNSDGSLKPEASINRAEFLKTLIVATEQPLVDITERTFPDVPASAWFAPYVNTAIALDWAKGYPDGTFKPGNLINRAEAAKLFTQAFDLPFESRENDQYWFDGYARALSDLSLLPYGVSIARFEAATEPSRVEVFEQLYRLLRAEGLFAEGDSAGIDTRRELSVPLPTGQTKITPDSSDDKFLTFTPTNQSSQGKLTLEVANQALSKNVSPGEVSVGLLTLKITPSSGNSTITGFQFRRNGNGKVTDFATLWVSSGQKILSAKVVPTSDFVYLELEEPFLVSRTETVSLMGNISPNAQGSSSRWVSYIPDWTNSSAKATLGLFPLGGSSINIK